jgi:predicted nucleic acid-binding protein
MIYLDTNVIVYSYVSPDDQKQVLSSQLIESLISDNSLFLSPLVVQELIFVLNKLHLPKPEISDIIELYKKYCRRNINKKLVLDAYELCLEVDNLKLINDAIHLKFAEAYTSKLITFDKDFNKFKYLTSIVIEILET